MRVIVKCVQIGLGCVGLGWLLAANAYQIVPAAPTAAPQALGERVLHSASAAHAHMSTPQRCTQYHYNKAGLPECVRQPLPGQAAAHKAVRPQTTAHRHARPISAPAQAKPKTLKPRRVAYTVSAGHSAPSAHIPHRKAPAALPKTASPVSGVHHKVQKAGAHTSTPAKHMVAMQQAKNLHVYKSGYTVYGNRWQHWPFAIGVHVGAGMQNLTGRYDFVGDTDHFPEDQLLGDQQRHRQHDWVYGIRMEIDPPAYPAWYVLAQLDKHEKTALDGFRAHILIPSQSTLVPAAKASHISVQNLWQATLGVAHIFIDNSAWRLSLGAGVGVLDRRIIGEIYDRDIIINRDARLVDSELAVVPVGFAQASLKLSAPWLLQGMVRADYRPSMAISGKSAYNEPCRLQLRRHLHAQASLGIVYRFADLG